MSEHLHEQSFDDVTDNAKQGLVGEFMGFMSENAKWWLIPFLIVFGLLALVLILGGTSVAPFIYTLF